MFCNDGATPIVRLLLLGCRVTVTLSSFFEHIHTLLETAVGSICIRGGASRFTSVVYPHSAQLP